MHQATLVCSQLTGSLLMAVLMMIPSGGMVWYFGKTAPLVMLCPFIAHLVFSLAVHLGMATTKYRGVGNQRHIPTSSWVLVMMKLSGYFSRTFICHSSAQCSSTLGVASWGHQPLLPGSTPVCTSNRFTHRASLQMQFCNDCSPVEAAVPQGTCYFCYATV